MLRKLSIAFLGLALSLSAASVDGLKIHSTVTGKGPRTVILVHGYTCDETTWTEQVPALEKQYRVVTLDLPGHGKSDSPKDGQLSMDLFARAIEAVRAEVNAERVVLVGHSMGTPVVLRYAHLYPRHTVALVFVDGLMPTAATGPSNQGAAMSGPAGHQTREAMVRTFFSESTTPGMQTKFLYMMLGAPEATAVAAMNATREGAGQTKGDSQRAAAGHLCGPFAESRFPRGGPGRLPNHRLRRGSGNGPLPDAGKTGRGESSACGISGEAEVLTNAVPGGFQIHGGA